MAHVEKYKASALGHMLAHYNRTSPANNDIDKSRTAQNYNLAPDRGDQLNFIKKRLANNVKSIHRSDLIMMCDWVVTMPKDLPAEKERDFFVNTYDFLVNKYGAKNVVSAYVHKDESTPHMHFAFLPIVKEMKNKKRMGQEKLSAKECITRTDLQKFHQQLQDYLEQKLNCRVNILNEATKDGNKSIADLKKQSQSTELLLNWLESAGQHAERTKMGRGGLLGEEAVKMPVRLFNQLVTLAKGSVDTSVTLKTLRKKRDSNAKAQVEVDELKKELTKQKNQVTQLQCELASERERGSCKRKEDIERITAKFMSRGLTNDDIERVKYAKVLQRLNSIMRATEDIVTISDGLRYTALKYYKGNKTLDGAEKELIKAYYAYNGNRLNDVQNAVKAVRNVLPLAVVSDELTTNLERYARNCETYIDNERKKAEIRAEVKAEKRRKLILQANQGKNNSNDYSR